MPSKKLLYTIAPPAVTAVVILSLKAPVLFIYPEKYIESGHAKIRKLTDTLKVRSDLEAARDTYKWASKQIKYAGFLPSHHGALQTLKTSPGDRTEFAELSEKTGSR